MSYLLRLSLCFLCVLPGCTGSDTGATQPGDGGMGGLDGQQSPSDARPATPDTAQLPDSTLVGDAFALSDGQVVADASTPADGSVVRDAVVAGDTTVSADSTATKSDAASKVDSAVQNPDAAVQDPDAAVQNPDAAVQNPDAAVNNGDVGPDQGLVAMESNLFVTPIHLEATAADEQFLSFPMRRFLPRIQGVGDVSHIQPWLMYQPGANARWKWLLMAFYVPAEAVAALPAETERVQAGRTSAWFARGAGGLAALPVNTSAATLAAPAGFVCGNATVSARFDLRLANGDIIADVVGVAMTVAREDDLNLGWLNGCDRNAVP